MASPTVWLEFTKGWKVSRITEAVETIADGFFNIDSFSTVPNPEQVDIPEANTEDEEQRSMYITETTENSSYWKRINADGNAFNVFQIWDWRVGLRSDTHMTFTLKERA